MRRTCASQTHRTRSSFCGGNTVRDGRPGKKVAHPDGDNDADGNLVTTSSWGKFSPPTSRHSAASIAYRAVPPLGLIPPAAGLDVAPAPVFPFARELPPPVGELLLEL